MAQRFAIQPMTKSLCFYSALNRVDCGTDFIGAGDVTVCFWVRKNRTSTNDYVLSNGKFKLFFGTTQTLNLRSVDGTTATTPRIKTNDWVFISVTRTSTGAVNYRLNGAAFGSANINSGTPVAGTTNVYLGNSDANGLPLYGKLKNLQIFNRILTTTEQDNLYRNGSLPTDYNTAVVRDFNFENDTYTTIYSRNNASLTGTITGAVFSPDVPLMSRKAGLIYEHREKSLGLETYDGSGDTVHPSVIDLGDSLTISGYRFWMANTPYTNNNIDFENPSIWASTDGITWVIPGGLTNPIVADPGGADYNNDTEIVYDPVLLKLRVYYRRVTGAANSIRMIESSDGITWANDQEVIALTQTEVCPQVIFYTETNSYVMWTVNPGGDFMFESLERRTSSDGITWSSATSCIVQNRDIDIWHFSLRKHDNKLIGAVGGYYSGSLYYIEGDYYGTEFSVNNTAIMRPSLVGWASDGFLYKPCLIVVNGDYYLYYSIINRQIARNQTGLSIRRELTRTTASNRVAVRDMGTALRFDGVDDEVAIDGVVASLGNIMQTPYTFSAWLMTTSTAQQTILSCGRTNSDSPYIILDIGQGTPGKPRFTNRSDSNLGDTAQTTTIKANDGKFHQIVGVSTSTALYLYFDGVLVASDLSATGGTATLNVANIGVLERTTKSGYFKGIIDEPRIWNRALTATEIQNLYLHGAVPRNGLVGEYLFDEASGTTAIDSSGNGNDGTITGATYTTDTPLRPRTSV